MDSINLRNFKRKVEKNKRRLRLVLSKVEKKAPLHLDQLAEKIDKEVWKEVSEIDKEKGKFIINSLVIFLVQPLQLFFNLHNIFQYLLYQYHLLIQ